MKSNYCIAKKEIEHSKNLCYFYDYLIWIFAQTKCLTSRPKKTKQQTNKPETNKLSGASLEHN